MSVGPGQTAFTVIPSAATSCATDAVSATTAALDAQYMALRGEGLWASCEAVLMIRPERRAFMCGIACFMP